jgi:hypothetical protein
MRTARKGKTDTICIVRYTRKDGYWLSNMGDDISRVGEKRDRNELVTEAFAVLEDDTQTAQQRRQKFNELVKAADPLKYAYDGHRADATAVRILSASSKPKFNMEDFILDQVDSEIYRGNSAKGIRAKTVVLLGKPQTGKTEFALAHFKHPIRINGESRAGLEALDRIGPQTDGLVIDDMDFTTDEKGNPRKVDFTKAFLDIEQESVIDGRYGRRTIPRGMPRIICCNGTEPPFAKAKDDPRARFWSPETVALHQEAIDDRIHVVHIRSKTYDSERTELRKIKKLASQLVAAAIQQGIAKAVASAEPSFW